MPVRPDENAILAPSGEMVGPWSAMVEVATRTGAEPPPPISIPRMSVSRMARANASWLRPVCGERQITGSSALSSEVATRTGRSGVETRTGTRNNPRAPKTTKRSSGVQVMSLIGSPKLVTRRAGLLPPTGTTYTSLTVVSARTNAISLPLHENAGYSSMAEALGVVNLRF